jgi:hypothetical protein
MQHKRFPSREYGALLLANVQSRFNRQISNACRIGEHKNKNMKTKTAIKLAVVITALGALNYGVLAGPGPHPQFELTQHNADDLRLATDSGSYTIDNHHGTVTYLARPAQNEATIAFGGASKARTVMKSNEPKSVEPAVGMREVATPHGTVSYFAPVE